MFIRSSCTRGGLAKLRITQCSRLGPPPTRVYLFRDLFHNENYEIESFYPQFP